jgi:hypothetical protein
MVYVSSVISSIFTRHYLGLSTDLSCPYDSYRLLTPLSDSVGPKSNGSKRPSGCDAVFASEYLQIRQLHTPKTQRAHCKRTLLDTMRRRLIVSSIYVENESVFFPLIRNDLAQWMLIGLIGLKSSFAIGSWGDISIRVRVRFYLLACWIASYEYPSTAFVRACED